ncbi:MAG: hydrogenase 3 maturation endopeptidase HyCI [Acidobacteriota bacterium]|nr:hydrogenase 3 maturation endopeptidase HyCI [Acidobacteriota bacterium]
MFPSPLKEALRRQLLPKPDGKAPEIPQFPKIAFVGIGSELRGDDAVGVVIVNRLAELQSSADLGGSLAGYLFINGGSAPENILGEVKAFQPEIIVFIDAAVLGQAPGAVRLIDTREEKISGISFCTHSLPLTIIANYIRQCLPCEIFVIGIEPSDMGFRPDCALTPPVAAASEEVVEAIIGEPLIQRHWTIRGIGNTT